MKSLRDLACLSILVVLSGCDSKMPTGTDSEVEMTWPSNADGDVFRRLVAHDFDFHHEYSIDFNVDFESWPPPAIAIESLKSHYPSTKIIPPDLEYGGYVQFQVVDRLTYDLVIEVQQKATALVADFGGRCDSWGVMQE